MQSLAPGEVDFHRLETQPVGEQGRVDVLGTIEQIGQEFTAHQCRIVAARRVVADDQQAEQQVVKLGEQLLYHAVLAVLSNADDELRSLAPQLNRLEDELRRILEVGGEN